MLLLAQKSGERLQDHWSSGLYHLFISNNFVSSKIFDNRDDFDFDTVTFPFLDGDIPGVPHME